mmetsp:Transcript_126780/g.189134  ORF Transcript_126780/g.189134 Transcript_126780/m.189134 type:complete len:318 (+) Transcript_126780:203-1156(+)
MFNRKKGGSLPTTSIPAGDQGGFGLPLGGNAGPDGSGRAIKMDAPVVKAWKQASSFTKYSYYILAFFFLLIFVGYRYLRYGNASIWLTCHATECTLEVTPPGTRTATVVFSRFQLHSAQPIKTDKSGNFLMIDTSKYEPPRAKGKKKGKTGSYKGPDEDGNYKSYSLKFREKSPDDVEKSEEDVEDGDFSIVKKYLASDPNGEEGVHVLHMRQFGLAQSRTRIRSTLNKVESYIKKRRQKLVVKESATLPWQGILCLIFGLMGVMLTLLIGQFWEEPPKRHGGPGMRRTPAKSSNKKPTFVVDTGRPSKYPPGYKKY